MFAANATKCVRTVPDDVAGPLALWWTSCVDGHHWTNKMQAPVIRCIFLLNHTSIVKDNSFFHGECQIAEGTAGDDDILIVLPCGSGDRGP
eukprot:3763657-Amphidinium_carterae.1